MRHLPKLICDVIPHKEQRYNTGGDYEKQHDDWFFTVSRMTPQEEFAILMHEQVEWFLCQMAGIKEKDITKFDLMWEKERLAGLHKDDDEPGLKKYIVLCVLMNYLTVRRN